MVDSVTVRLEKLGVEVVLDRSGWKSDDDGDLARVCNAWFPIRALDPPAYDPAPILTTAKRVAAAFEALGAKIVKVEESPGDPEAIY